MDCAHVMGREGVGVLFLLAGKVKKEEYSNHIVKIQIYFVRSI
jgi:hypothetical protein